MIKFSLNYPRCSECGFDLGEILPMKDSKIVVMECQRCGYVSDIGLRLTEDKLHTQFELDGVDPEGGKINMLTGDWEGGKGW